MNSSEIHRNWRSVWPDVGFSLALFVLALIPRLIGLQTFVTADEAKWVYRSAQFWLAVLHGDWANTASKLKPAVTTMWSAGPGFWVYNRFHENLPFADFLAAVPEWQVNPAVLHATRIPTILLSCGMVAFVFLLLRPVLGHWPAFLAGFFLAFDPLFLAHSRFLHHDALVTLFALPSLLLAIRSAKGGWGTLVASAILGGLAFLTKSPIFFLGVFVGALFLLIAWQAGRQSGEERQKLLMAAGRFAVWGLISYLTFIVIWPAAWLQPVSLPLNVIFEALQESASEGDDLFINLGVFYYPVYFVFYSTLPVLAGLAVWGFQRKLLADSARYTTTILAWFALTFIIFMTLSDKRSARYILPAITAVDVIAASSWAVWLARRQAVWLQATVVGAIVAVQLLAVIPYAPYYITYINPFVGGPITAHHLIKIGWGEGMDQVGAWLNSQPHPETIRVGADYGSTLTPYFKGEVAGPTDDHLDYVVSYIKQRQGGSPPLEVVTYYEQLVQPQTTVVLGGTAYAQIYPGPAVRLVETAGPVLAFRSHTQFAPIGQTLTIDLVWPTAYTGEIPERTLSVGGEDKIWASEVGDTVHLSLLGDVPVTQHRLDLPMSMPPGTYTLFFEDQPLGQIETRYAQPPPHFQPLDINFGDEIRLVGFAPNYVVNDDQLTVNLAFQATPKAWTDYTVFVHLVDDAGNRLAGHDAPPIPPTSQWLKGEVVLDSHTLTLPELSPEQTYRIVVGLYAATGQALGEAYTLPEPVNLTPKK